MANLRRTLSATSIIGDKIYNSEGEKIGHVKELMIDVWHGKVSYVVLSFGGLLTIGEKLFAIPLTKLTVDEANKRLLLDITAEELKEAPGFDPDHWPDEAPEFIEAVYEFHGVKPYWI